MLDYRLFVHPLEAEALEKLNEATFFQEELMHFYKCYTEKMKKPDLLGKTLKVDQFQFKDVYAIVERIGRYMQMALPDIYVYEDFYYGAEAKGCQKPWIELSAKTIADFNPAELTFLIAREMVDIRMNHTYYYTLINETPTLLEAVGSFPGIEVLVQAWKTSAYSWSRIANYTADCFGYLLCADLQPAVGAITKLVLNNKDLADNVNIRHYLQQAEEINHLNDEIQNLTKLDEMVPYAPLRIKQLIAYAASERGIMARAELVAGGGVSR